MLSRCYCEAIRFVCSRICWYLTRLCFSVHSRSAVINTHFTLILKVKPFLAISWITPPRILITKCTTATTGVARCWFSCIIKPIATFAIFTHVSNTWCAVRGTSYACFVWLKPIAKVTEITFASTTSRTESAIWWAFSTFSRTILLRKHSGVLTFGALCQRCALYASAFGVALDALWLIICSWCTEAWVTLRTFVRRIRSTLQTIQNSARLKTTRLVSVQHVSSMTVPIITLSFSRIVTVLAVRCA